LFLKQKQNKPVVIGLGKLVLNIYGFILKEKRKEIGKYQTGKVGERV